MRALPSPFAIFINDMCEGTPRVLLSLFADDGCAWPVLMQNMRLDSMMKRMREFCSRVSEWSRRWHLSFSPNKTQMVLFGRKEVVEPDAVAICGSEISIVSSQRYLGLHFDDDGRWRSHFRAIETKAIYTAHSSLASAGIAEASHPKSRSPSSKPCSYHRSRTPSPSGVQRWSSTSAFCRSSHVRFVVPWDFLAARAPSARCGSSACLHLASFVFAA